MALAQLGVLLRVNNDIVPSYAMPTYTAGVMYPNGGGIVDLFGRPVGARGWPSIELRWDEISMRGLTYWQSLIDPQFLSAPIIGLTLPDSRSTKRLEGYAYHSKFTRGVLWQPELDPGGTWGIYGNKGTPNGEMYFEGGVTIRITELGRSGR